MSVNAAAAWAAQAAVDAAVRGAGADQSEAAARPSIRLLAAQWGADYKVAWKRVRATRPDESGRRVFGRDGRLHPAQRCDAKSRNADVASLHPAGWPAAAIAERVRCCKSTMYRVLRADAADRD